jgi:hypothetical protein
VAFQWSVSACAHGSDGRSSRAASCDAPDWLHQHGARGALELSIDQVQDERNADALTIEIALSDTAAVEEGDVICLYASRPSCAVIGTRDWPSALR